MFLSSYHLCHILMSFQEKEASVFKLKFGFSVQMISLQICGCNQGRPVEQITPGAELEAVAWSQEL